MRKIASQITDRHRDKQCLNAVLDTVAQAIAMNDIQIQAEPVASATFFVTDGGADWRCPHCRRSWSITVEEAL